MSNISIWGYSIPCSWLVQAELDYLTGLPQALPTVEWSWAEMDRVWFYFKLDNRRALTGQRVGKFYSHPVWLMNGIFSALDPVSSSQRTAIANHLNNVRAKSVADYGGGFGELARAICRINPEARVSIVEPYPSHVGSEQLDSEPHIRFVPRLSADNYDAIVAQDVLEHVENPIRLASEIAGALREGGQVIFANCFYPVIQCHLPSAFYLRYTFPWIMKALGLRYIGRVDGAEHAYVFERIGSLNYSRAQRADAVSRLLGPVFNKVRELMSQIKGWVLRS